MSTRWAARFAVSGDLRFLSHHDVMRLMTRAAARAELPLRYSEGFNPRPKLSLPLPRPVGVAGRDELLLLELDGPLSGAELGERLAGQLPAGMALLSVVPADGRRPPAATAARYEMELTDAERPRVQQRLAELAAAEAWPVTRRAKPGRGRRPPEAKSIEAKDRIRDLALSGGRLSFTLLNTPAGGLRPQEVLELVGLTEGADAASPADPAVARLVRTNTQCESRDPGRQQGTQENE